MKRQDLRLTITDLDGDALAVHAYQDGETTIDTTVGGCLLDDGGLTILRDHLNTILATEL